MREICKSVRRVATVRWVLAASLILAAPGVARARLRERAGARARTGGRHGLGACARTHGRDPAGDAGAAASAPAGPRLDIYGFAMLDMGYQTNRTTPNWFDVVRPTKLPAFENQFGEDGHFFAGVRQSRLGVKGFIPTEAGEIKTIFEFELFGTGVDAGQTTFRLRHAWGELGQVGAGQTWSPFMDIDVFPNSIEYWGPTAWCSSATSSCAGCPGRRATRASPSRWSAGCQRRPGRIRGPHRARGRQGPLPPARPLGALPPCRRLGPRPDRRHRAPDEVGRPQHRPVRPQRRCDRLGRQPQLEHEDRGEARRARSRSCTAKASRTT